MSFVDNESSTVQNGVDQAAKNFGKKKNIPVFYRMCY